MKVKLNKIYKKDCFEIVKYIEPLSVQLILIDPPSGAGLTKEFWDKKEDPFRYAKKYSLFLYDCSKTLKNTGSLYIYQWIGQKNPTHMVNLLVTMNAFILTYDHLYFKEMLTWAKQRGNGNRRGYLQTNEHILWYVRDNKKFTWNKEFQYSKNKRLFTITGSKNKSVYKRLTTVWTDIMEMGFGTCPSKFKETREKYGKVATPKPPEFYERKILLHTCLGDTVFIPFSGSGVAEKVCQDLGRSFISCELNKQ
jgi:DNA modification methylase